MAGQQSIIAKSTTSKRTRIIFEHYKWHFHTNRQNFEKRWADVFKITRMVRTVYQKKKAVKPIQCWHFNLPLIVLPAIFFRTEKTFLYIQQSISTKEPVKSLYAIIRWWYIITAIANNRDYFSRDTRMLHKLLKTTVKQLFLKLITFFKRARLSLVYCDFLRT